MLVDRSTHEPGQMSPGMKFLSVFGRGDYWSDSITRGKAMKGIGACDCFILIVSIGGIVKFLHVATE